MAFSLSTLPFLGAPSSVRLSSLRPSDLRNLPFRTLQVGSHRHKLQVQAVGNTFGNYFRVTTYGESHGGGVGCVIDGCPPRIPLSESDIQFELDRRRPGQSRVTTLRKETDTCQIYSGIAEGMTTGSPIMVKVPNTNQRGDDYNEMSEKYRPSHADATYDFKYGVRSVQGGGRSSARETIGRVAAGAVAKKILKHFSGTEVLAYASQVHKVVLPQDCVDHEGLTLDQIESNIVRCPNPEYAEQMIDAIDAVRVRGDSVGGVVMCIVRNVPRGLGSPVFDKLEAELAKAAMSLPASKGCEFGSGFAGTFMTGSEHNDEFFIDEHGRIRTRTNRSGGIQEMDPTMLFQASTTTSSCSTLSTWRGKQNKGGISNGEVIEMRVAFKPTPTIARKQITVTRNKQEAELIFRGRQDPCVVPRAVPVVEAMVALVLVDQVMAHYAQCQIFPLNLALQEPLELPRLEPLHGIPL
ncbi:chorismate synthase 2, chloroplastic-like [Actinidia eriantha]|uniref:chorismate synthase 2, chloroplastic-like n=1 Tax=Actinidia eriantha TaxID=165200 RepID=UPI002582E7EF|nr:chorismate synthase 2, chloroplastic-like [Actinidia eriantha]